MGHSHDTKERDRNKSKTTAHTKPQSTVIPTTAASKLSRDRRGKRGLPALQ
jgi:hypothetical protein